MGYWKVAGLAVDGYGNSNRLALERVFEVHMEGIRRALGWY